MIKKFAENLFQIKLLIARKFPIKIPTKRLSGLLKILFIVSCLSVQSSAQEIQQNEFGLFVVSDFNIYKKLIEQDSFKKLVNLEKFIPTIKKDVRYADTNNFARKKFYNTAKIYLRLPSAIALKNVQEELLKKNLSLKIYDAYRPYTVTKKIWEYVKDDRYAADPKKGSRHNRGCAVDLTIVNLSTNTEIEMPTEYDDFSVKAHQDYINLPEHILKNRELLSSLMIENGFEPLSSEWWHFDFKGWNKFELMDIDFDELIKDELNSKKNTKKISNFKKYNKIKIK